MQWQPIETAPKDGIEIVLGNEKYPYYPIGRWTTVEDEPELMEYYGLEKTFKGWYYQDYEESPGVGDVPKFLGTDYDIKHGLMPTHWMPKIQSKDTNQ